MIRLSVYLVCVAGLISCGDHQHSVLSVQNSTHSSDTLSVDVVINGKGIFSGSVAKASTNLDFVSTAFHVAEDSVCVDVSVNKGTWKSHQCEKRSYSREVVVHIADGLPARTLDSLTSFPSKEKRAVYAAEPKISIAFIKDPNKKPL